MGDQWFDTGMPSKDDMPSGGGGSGYAWWQKKVGDSDDPVPRRFWLPKEETKEISFVDDKCFRIFEHTFWIDDSPGNATCIAKRDSRGNPKKGTCPLCDSGNKASHTGFFTIVDHTGYENKDGKQVKDIVCLLPAKYYTLELIRAKYKKLSGVIGRRFSVTRTGAKQAPVVGDDWDYMDKEDVDDYEAISYEDILAPYSTSEMKEIAHLAEWRGKKHGKSSSSDEGDFSSEEEVSYDDDPGAVPF